MSGLANLAAATAAFVGSHFLLSHPLRRPLAGRLGEGPFLGLYSLVAFATFGWLVWAAIVAPAEPIYWLAPPWAWDIATIVMLFAAILLIGSLLGNPAFPDPEGKLTAPAEAKGVFAITRHPMLWSFIIWAAVHAVLWGSAANLIVAVGVAILSFFGALAQDAKKRAKLGDGWRDWEARTAFWPFAAQLSDKARWRDAIPRAHALAGGATIWLLATGAHAWLGGPVAGPWRWFGQ